MENVSDRKNLSTKDMWKEIITSKNKISMKIGWRILRWEGRKVIEVQTVEIGRFCGKTLYFSKVEWRKHTQLSHALVLRDCLWSKMPQSVKWLSAGWTHSRIHTLIGTSHFLAKTNTLLVSSRLLFYYDSVGFIPGGKAVRPLISIRYWSLEICGVLLSCLLLSGTSLILWGGVTLCPLAASASNWPILPAPDDRWYLWSSRWNEN
jgi:hypothetical protein